MKKKDSWIIVVLGLALLFIVAIAAYEQLSDKFLPEQGVTEETTEKPKYLIKESCNGGPMKLYSSERSLTSIFQRLSAYATEFVMPMPGSVSVPSRSNRIWLYIQTS